MKINRHTAIIAGSIVAGVLVVSLAATAGHSYAVQSDKKNAAHEQVVYARGATDQRNSDSATILSFKTKQSTECAKEMKYYGLLTAMQKKTVLAPDCQ